MKRNHAVFYIQSIKMRENREIDYYDLMLFAGLSLELTKDLRKLNKKLSDPFQYFDKNVYIYGPPGSGKTVLAGHIFSEQLRSPEFGRGDGTYEINRFLTEKNYDGPIFKWEHFCWYPGLIQRVKRTFDKNYEGPSEYEILEQVAENSLLVLDDIGAEYASEWSKNFMYLLVEERKTNLLPTIFTSNCSLEQLAEKYDNNKITSRIAGICQDRIINLTGKDYRVNTE